MKEKNLPKSRLHTLMNIFRENVSIVTRVPGDKWDVFQGGQHLLCSFGCYYVLFGVWGVSKDNTSGIKCLLTDNFRMSKLLLVSWNCSLLMKNFWD